MTQYRGATAMGLPPSWRAYLADEFEQPYMRQLMSFLTCEEQSGKQIFPRNSDIFSAFDSTPLERVKVVVLGQDPYHGAGQAHGLAFSVKAGVKVPPSLRNIYKELNTELGLPIPDHGQLTAWAQRGVLLLNSVLTVQSAQAGSHQGRGWERFTDKVIQVINDRREGIVFLLWGSYAQRKGMMIDRQRHCVLEAAHPSPLSAYRGFFGCGHFAATNDYLISQKRTPIDWSVSDIKHDVLIDER